MQLIAVSGHWAIYSSPNDDREGYNLYATKHSDIVGSLDMLINEEHYEDERGFIRPVPKATLVWLNKVWERFDWETGEYHGY